MMRILSCKCWWAIALVCLGGCMPWPLESESKTSGTPAAVFLTPVSSGILTYTGGNVTVKARLAGVAGDSSSIAWTSGSAIVRGQGVSYDEDGALDTAWVSLRWDSTTMVRDSALKLSLDTVKLLNSGSVLGSVTVRLQDVLPIIKSVKVGADTASLQTIQVTDDTLNFLIHAGATGYMKFSFKDVDANYAVRFRPTLPLSLPGGGSLRWRNGEGDSVLVWQAPSTLYDTLINFTETDALGMGSRVWKLRLSTYTEEGAAWVATAQGTELVKFALTGGNHLQEVLRLSGFGNMEGLEVAVDPSRNEYLAVVDRQGKKFLEYSPEGVSTLSKVITSPRSVACDFDNSYCWVGVHDSAKALSRLLRVGGDTASLPNFPGDITSLAVDQNAYGRVWAASRDSGFVARISFRTLDTLVRGVFARPTAISFDDSLSLLWVADLKANTVSAIDSTGKVIRTLSGFGQPVSVSAAHGRVWVADNLSGTVTRWGADGICQAAFSGFLTPQAVAIDPRDPTAAWALDMGAGELLRFHGDSLVARSQGRGLDRPSLLAAYPSNE